MKIKNAVGLLFLIAVCFTSLKAQTSKGDPFAVGEVLNYEAKLSRALVGGLSIGGADMTFSIANAANGKDYLFLGEAVSKGSLLRLFRYRFLQRMESTVDREKFHVLKTVKRDEQNSRIRTSEANFNYETKQVTYVEINPADRASAPRRIASAIKDNTLDLVSGLYSLRRMPLAVGKNFDLYISDSGLVYRVPVKVTARELENSVLGKVWCFRLEPQIFGTGRLIEDDGKMSLWITEDSRRIPVRAEIYANIGKIEIKLKKPKKK